jgi:hypothetical protein
VFEPFFDEDIGVVYLMANGDSSVKFWEVSEEAPYVHYLTENLSTRQQSGVARLPKTSCDVRNVCHPPPLSLMSGATFEHTLTYIWTKVEVGRFVKLSGSTVEEFGVRVPRTRVR